MRTLKRIFDFYILSNIHVGFAVFCLTKITLLVYGITDNLVPFFVFFSTVASYNFIRLYRISMIQGWIFEFLKSRKKLILGLTFISVLVILYLALQLQFAALLWLLPFGLFTFFYVVPFGVKKHSSTALRSVAFLKLFLIALSWAGVTVLVPLVNYHIEIDKAVAITFVQRFLFVAAITIPFDIRDVDYDDDALKTLPQVIGINASKKVGLFFLMLFLGLEFLKVPVTAVPLRIHFFVAVIALSFLFKATKTQHRYYSSFFVESIPIIWWVMVLAGLT